MHRTLLLLAALTMACGGSPEPAPPDAPATTPAAAAPTPEGTDDDGAATTPQGESHASIDVDDPSTCVGCHATVVEEWKQSMHSMAHHDVDPIYGAMRQLRMAKQGEAVGAKCLTCHNPQDTSNPDSVAGKAGVSCAACHTSIDVKGGDAKGAKALVRGEPGVLYGPHDLEMGASPVHGSAAAPVTMTDPNTLCLACHKATKNPQGVAACTTGPEVAAHEGLEQGCTDCHMPRVEGPSGSVSTRADHASHQFVGPHRAWYQDDDQVLKDAVDLSAAFEGDTLQVTLANRSGHGFPTGFPGRMALVKVVGLDADGQPVWSNITDDPMAQSPDSVLNKVYVDAEGKPTMPPFAVELARDNRLTGGETRTLSYDVPAEAVKARVVLIYRLLPPPAAQALGLADAPEAEPKPFRTLVVER